LVVLRCKKRVSAGVITDNLLNDRMSKVIQKVKLIEFTETKIGRGQRRIGRISPDLSSKNLFVF